jgi:glycosyltransferase involved in cell wall biosynthesis
MDKKINILFISQYFPPEMGALAARTYEHCVRWVKRGHKVIIISGTPNHPTGKIYPGYKNKLIQRENVDGIQVIRTWVYLVPNRKPWERIVNYTSFMISSIFGILFGSSKIDAVIASSPQLLVGITGYLASQLKRCPFIFEVRDLWPESITAVSHIRNDHISLKLLNWLANFFYKKADKVIAVSPAIKEVIISKGGDKNKVEMIPNGVDLGLFKPAVINGRKIRERFNLNNKFIVSYIGTIGLAHGLGIVLEVAKKLEKYKDITFLFVGEGAEKEKLIKRSREMKLKNVLFVPRQPKSEIPAFLAASDVALVLLRKREVFKTVIPSKMLEIMAAKKPMILGVEGQAKEILKEADAGIAIEPENVGKLCGAIVKLYHDRELRDRLGSNGRNFVEKNYNRDILALKYEKVLVELVRNLGTKS